jgi:hypothetical protein
MNGYQKLIHEIAPDLDAAAVEAAMRLQYGVLDHLPRETFAEEVQIARACEAEAPGFLADVKASMGY